MDARYVIDVLRASDVDVKPTLPRGWQDGSHRDLVDASVVAENEQAVRVIEVEVDQRLESCICHGFACCLVRLLQPTSLLAFLGQVSL